MVSQYQQDEQLTTPHLKSMNTTKDHDMTLELQVLSWTRQTMLLDKPVIGALIPPPRDN